MKWIDINMKATKLEQLCQILNYQGGTIHQINREVNEILKLYDAKLEKCILNLDDNEFNLLKLLLVEIKKV